MIRRPRGRPRHDDVLTPAEWRTVEMLRHGMSVRAIAQRQGVSRDAVKFHIGNAAGKLGLSGLRALRRWQGIAGDSPLKEREKQDMAALRLGSIGQLSRSVSDIEAAVAWYRDVLGLTHLFTTGGMAFFDCGGTRLYLQQGPVRSESIPYFTVPDIHGAHAALVARGAVSTAVPHIIHRDEQGGELWMAFFADPDAPHIADPHGRLIALMAQITPDR
ncbi:VOC family protein [Sphingobium nicotianae]|uniref:VOC family protein n=1 Tax=Sphingobium nicotianae TaxID=2782607 RepID=A0A9X1IQH0_9SPHN|nr:VOC family protein [Sphingobium nicotianae]MBT2186616.1 VOC family protein [Sphingobium nicotianae]